MAMILFDILIIVAIFIFFILVCLNIYFSCTNKSSSSADNGELKFEFKTDPIP